MFEDGHLTDGLGNRVNFKNTIIIMTSNIGARFIQKKSSMGFQSSDTGEIAKSVSDMVLGEVKRTFNPEFINRIDEIIVFEALNDDDLAAHHGAAGHAAEREPDRSEADASRSRPRSSTGSSRSPARTARTAPARCAAPSSATSRTRCPEELIRGHLARRRDRGLSGRRRARLPSGRRAGSRTEADLARLEWDCGGRTGVDY